jgi:hypothetical protein
MAMPVGSAVLIDVPMPIRTPRLTIRPKKVGGGAITSVAVAETWEELNQWMRWAEDRDAFTAELMATLLRDSVSLSRGYSGGQICFLVEKRQTGTAMPASMFLGCPT